MQGSCYLSLVLTWRIFSPRQATIGFALTRGFSSLLPGCSLGSIFGLLYLPHSSYILGLESVKANINQVFNNSLHRLSNSNNVEVFPLYMLKQGFCSRYLRQPVHDEYLALVSNLDDFNMYKVIQIIFIKLYQMILLIYCYKMEMVTHVHAGKTNMGFYLKTFVCYL